MLATTIYNAVINDVDVINAVINDTRLAICAV